jgi:branched-chain amino acid transport system substrate-binding protein
MRRLPFYAPTLSIVFTLGASLLLLAGCSGDVVKIGVVVPETGDFQSYGVSLRRGIEIAAAELQADLDAPVKFELEFIDSESDLDKAAATLDRVYDSGAPIAIGGATSGEALRMVEVVDARGRILVSPSASSPELTGISSNFYRTYPSDLLEANKLASFTSEHLKVETFVIWAQPDVYGRGLESVIRQELEKLGGITVEETFELPKEASDLTGSAEAILDTQPGAVFIAGYDMNVADAIRALHAVGYEGKVLTTSAFATPAGIERAGEAADGVFLTQIVFDVDSEHAHVRRFVDAYKAAFGEVPDLYAAHGYDTLMVIIAALEGRPFLHGEILKGLRGIKEFPGVTGSIQFDERGDVKKFSRVYQISEGGLINFDDMIRRKREEVAAKKRELQQRLMNLSREGTD